MDQIASIWNNLRNNIQNLLNRENYDNDKRITLIFKFLIKEVNLNHQKNDHKIQNLVFVRASQTNIGQIQCQHCFLQSKNNFNYQYSLKLIELLEDVFYFIDQVSSCFLNDQQFLEEKNFHQLRFYNQIKEIFDTKSIKKDIISKISKFILEIESNLFFPEDFVDYLGISHSSRISRFQLNKIVQNIKITQQDISKYRDYINLLPKVRNLEQFHPKSDYIRRQTISSQYLAILLSYNIIIYDLKNGSKFSMIKVDFVNNIQLFKFTQDQNYLVFAYKKPYRQLIFNMKLKKISQILDTKTSFLECIEFKNQNYLLFYDKKSTVHKYFSIEQQSFSDFRFFKYFSKLDNMIQVIKVYNSFERKWKAINKHSITKQMQVTKQFRLHYIGQQNMSRLYYSLVLNQSKMIRRVSSQDYYIKDTYFISKDESYIVSSMLSFYEISTGKIAFQIKLGYSEVVQNLELGDGKIEILTKDNHYIYEQVNKKQQQR